MISDPVLRDFEARAKRDAARVVASGGGRVATVGDVDALARAADLALDRARPAPRSAVVLAAANGPGFLAALIALRRRNLVPLLADAAVPDAEAERIAGRLGAVAVLRSRAAWPRDPEDFTFHPTGLEAAPMAPGTDYVKLTSGSTGEPCGIAVAAEAMAADDDQLTRTMELEDGGPFVASIPLSHSYGLSSLALPALRRGVALVFPLGTGADAPLRAAAASGATFFPTVPAYLGALVALSERPPFPPSLRRVVSAGAPLPPPTARRFRETFGVPVHVFYGASEVGGITYDPEGGAGERGTVGVPVSGVRIRLVGDDGREAAEGRVSVTSPAAAARVLPADDGRLEGGGFLSADLATWDGGELRLLGRADAWINVDGRKVNPREVESVLAALPGVREAAVIGVRPGGGDREIVRAVIAGDPRSLTYDRVAGFCRERLSRHKVPKSIVVVEALPRNARGKVDRAALGATRPGGAKA